MLLVGECDDRNSERIERLRTALEGASIASTPVAQIRETIWTKLLTNMSMSVLCLVTGQTARAVRDDADLRDIIPRLLDEANSVAQSCVPGVKRLARSGPAPDHKPSILQDYELGRAMEIDVLVRAPAAFARAAGLVRRRCSTCWRLSPSAWRGDKGLYAGLSVTREACTHHGGRADQKRKPRCLRECRRVVSGWSAEAVRRGPIASNWAFCSSFKLA